MRNLPDSHTLNMPLLATAARSHEPKVIGRSLVSATRSIDTAGQLIVARAPARRRAFPWRISGGLASWSFPADVRWTTRRTASSIAVSKRTEADSRATDVRLSQYYTHHDVAAHCLGIVDRLFDLTSYLMVVNRRPKRTPYRRPKGTPFVERCDGYGGRAVRAGCGVGRA